MDNSNIKFKSHPYQVYVYLGRFAYLLIFPLVLQLLFTPQTFFAQISAGALNVLLAVLLVAAAVVRSQSIAAFCCSNGTYIFKRGVILKKSVTLKNKDSINSVSVTQGILQRAVGVLCVTVSTNSAAGCNAEKLYLSRKSAKTLLYSVFLQHTHQRKKLLWSSSLKSIFLYAVNKSGFTAGLMVLSPFLNRIGSLLGQQYTQPFYDSGFTAAQTLVWFGLPPVLALLAVILAAGYGAAVGAQIAACINHKLYYTGTFLHITKGILPKSEYVLPCKSITAVTFRQNLFMVLFQTCTVYVHTVRSSQKKHGDFSVVLPYSFVPKAVKSVKEFYPLVCTAKYKQGVQPEKRAIFSYLYPALMLMAGAAALWGIMLICSIKKEFADMVLLFFMPLCVLWLAVRYMAFKHCGVFVGDLAYKVCVCKGFSLYTTVVPTENVQWVNVTQNIFQHVSKRCSVFLDYCHGGKVLCIKHLSYENAKDIVSRSLQHSTACGKI